MPLNTATLAIQNLQGDGVFDCVSEDQNEMVHGLAGSLQLMEKVSETQVEDPRILAETCAGPQRRPLVQQDGIGQILSSQSPIRFSQVYRTHRPVTFGRGAFKGYRSHHCFGPENRSTGMCCCG